MASVIENGGFYVHDTNPTETVNPKQVGAHWTNYKTGKIYVCSDNTQNKNKWTILNPDIEIPSSIPRNIKIIDTKKNGVSYGTLPMWGCVPDTWYTNTMGHDVWLCLKLTGRYGQSDDDPILTVVDKDGKVTGYYVGIGGGDQYFRCPLLDGGRYYFNSRNEITGGTYHPYNCVYSSVWYEW